MRAKALVYPAIVLLVPIGIVGGIGLNKHLKERAFGREIEEKAVAAGLVVEASQLSKFAPGQTKGAVQDFLKWTGLHGKRSLPLSMVNVKELSEANGHAEGLLKEGAAWQDDPLLGLGFVTFIDYLMIRVPLLVASDPAEAKRVVRLANGLCRRMIKSNVKVNADHGQLGLQIIGKIICQAAVIKPNLDLLSEADGLAPAKFEIDAKECIKQEVFEDLRRTESHLNDLAKRWSQAGRYDINKLRKYARLRVLSFYTEAVETWEGDTPKGRVKWNSVLRQHLNGPSSITVPEFANELNELLQRQVGFEPPVLRSKEPVPLDLLPWFIAAAKAGGKSPAGIKGAKDRKGRQIRFESSPGIWWITAGGSAPTIGPRHMSWDGVNVRIANPAEVLEPR